MTITTDDLKKALGPVAEIDDAETVELDLGKVATRLVKRTRDVALSSEPMKGLDGLCDEVDAIDALLSKAISDKEGRAFVTTSRDELVEKFEVAKAFVARSGGKGYQVVNTMNGTVVWDGESEEDAKRIASERNAAAMKGKKTNKADETTDEENSPSTEAGSTDTDDDAGETKGDDVSKNEDEGWTRDMAPAEGPLRRSERMTKGERPVMGRRGARSSVQKFQDARDRAMGRRAGGGSDRCMS